MNSLKFSFTNIQGLCWNCVECESFLESNSLDILAICETNFNDSIDSGKLSVVDYLSLIQKDSNIHMYGFVVYAMEGFPFAWDLSLESSVDSYLCFWLALLHTLSYFLFLYRSPSLFLCIIFDSVSSNIDEDLWINPSAKVLFFGGFNIHKDWLNYCGGTDRPAELLKFFYLKWPYSDCSLSCSDPWLWLWQSCSFGFISFFWC